MDAHTARQVIEEHTKFTVDHVEHSNRFVILRESGDVARNVRHNSDAGMTETQFINYAREVERAEAEKTGNFWRKQFEKAAAVGRG